MVFTRKISNSIFTYPNIINQKTDIGFTFEFGGSKTILQINEFIKFNLGFLGTGFSSSTVCKVKDNGGEY
jgi:hypothetical protein